MNWFKIILCNSYLDNKPSGKDMELSSMKNPGVWRQSGLINEARTSGSIGKPSPACLFKTVAPLTGVDQDMGTGVSIAGPVPC